MELLPGLPAYVREPLAIFDSSMQETKIQINHGLRGCRG